MSVIFEILSIMADRIVPEREKHTFPHKIYKKFTFRFHKNEKPQRFGNVGFS